MLPCPETRGKACRQLCLMLAMSPHGLAIEPGAVSPNRCAHVLQAVYASQREPSCQQARLSRVLGRLLLLQAQQLAQGLAPGGALCLSDMPGHKRCDLVALQPYSLAGVAHDAAHSADSEHASLHMRHEGVCHLKPALLLG